jgi:hypothetical protein
MHLTFMMAIQALLRAKISSQAPTKRLSVRIYTAKEIKINLVSSQFTINREILKK